MLRSIVSPLRLSSALVFAAISFVLYNCDVLENDVDPKPDIVETSSNKVVVFPNSTGLIDLNSLVKSSQAVKLGVTSQPSRGTLSTFAPGLLQYAPNQGFIKGRDAFTFSVFASDNTILKTDSVIIIVDSDTTNLPCGYFAQNDQVIYTSSRVQINVLLNDYLCGDSTLAKVEVYRPDPSYPPYVGTATVENNIIVYTPSNSFTGVDKLIYKVSNIADPSKFSFATVYISRPMPCNWTLNSDYFDATLDSLVTHHVDTLHLPILVNDIFCDSTGVVSNVSIVSANPRGHTVTNNKLNYILPHPLTQTFTDSVTYRVCRGAECKTAIARVNVH